MQNISQNIIEKILGSYGAYYSTLSGIDKKKIVEDVLSEKKVHDQIEIFCQSTDFKKENLKQKKVLEVGSGFGIFVSVTRRDYGMLTQGIEPSEEGFNSSFELSRKVVQEYGFDKNIISNIKGESLPYPDNYFDIIFSSTVLEHVENPEKVISESLRVLKPGGILHFIYPNHHSFFDGHYSVFHPPLIFNGKFFPFIIKYVYRRNPEFAKTLRTELNYFSTKKIIQRLEKSYNIEYCSFGEKIFLERMRSLDFNSYAGLGKIKVILIFFKRLKLNLFLAKVLLLFKMWDPIILTLKKSD